MFWAVPGMSCANHGPVRTAASAGPGTSRWAKDGQRPYRPNVRQQQKTIMKIAYRLMFIVSVVMLIFLSALDVAIPRDEFVATRLAEFSSKWEIRYLTQDGLPGNLTDPIKTKSLLVDFLTKNRIPTTSIP